MKRRFIGASRENLMCGVGKGEMKLYQGGKAYHDGEAGSERRERKTHQGGAEARVPKPLGARGVSPLPR